MSETYKNQNVLPQLPIPELSDTTELFLRCLKPLADPAGYEKTAALAQDFLQNEGALLQKKLIEYTASIKPNSWLMPYSRDIYLNMRKPIPIEGNFLFELSPLGVLEESDYLGFLSVFVHCIGHVFLELKNETLPPMTAREDPLCMKQFEGAFCGTKIPHADKDEFRIHKYSEVNSFGVFCNNRFYTVKLIDGDSSVVSAERLLSALTQIYADKSKPDEISFCAAGFAGSDKAAAIIGKMCELDINAKGFDAVNKSMFNLTLTDVLSSAHTPTDKLYLGAENAWPYKPWSITAYTDKICSYNIEHTYLDGMSHMYLIERVIDKMKECDAPVANAVPDAHEDILTPVAFDTNCVKEELKAVKTEYLNAVSGFSGAVYERAAIPVKALKERKIGVDFFLQLSYQYAQLAAFGETRCTHESVSVTQFYDGRTSEIRTVSEEAVAFIKALSEGMPEEELSALLSRASDEHSARVKASKRFCSFIRHSAGLNDMFVRFGGELGITQKPKLFSDPNYVRYCTQELSTSTVGNAWYINKFTFAPQTERGLGIGYITHGDKFIADISYYKSEQKVLERFVSGLDEYFDKTEKLFLKN